MAIDYKIRSAFGKIKADDELKNITEKAVLNSRPKITLHKMLIPAVCMLVLTIGIIGVSIYFSPVSVISIDVNPSLELGVNRFDKVISATGYNDGGNRLAEDIGVRFMDYADAVEKILSSRQVTDYTAAGEEVSVAVVALDGSGGEVMLEKIENCTGNGVFCRQADFETVSCAHEEGLSYGKYSAYLEAKAENPDLTVEDVYGLTMRELHELCKHKEDHQGGHHGNGNGNGGHGNGGHGNGHG